MNKGGGAVMMRRRDSPWSVAASSPACGGFHERRLRWAMIVSSLTSADSPDEAGSKRAQQASKDSASRCPACSEDGGRLRVVARGNARCAAACEHRHEHGFIQMVLSCNGGDAAIQGPKANATGSAPQRLHGENRRRAESAQSNPRARSAAVCVTRHPAQVIHAMLRIQRSVHSVFGSEAQSP